MTDETHRGHERRRRFALGPGQQLAQPIEHLAQAVVGQPIGRPLGPASFAAGADRLDQATLGQPLDGVVERAAAEVEKVILMALADEPLHFVGVQRTFAEQA